MKEASLLYCLPDNPFFYAGAGPSGDHAVQEATYACTFQAFTHLYLEILANDMMQTADGSSHNTSVTVWGRRILR